MKNYILAAAAIGAILLIQKAHAKQASQNTVEAGMHTDGTNWTGQSMMDRLNGSDLISQAFPNLNGGTSADPGKVGIATIDLGAITLWNGELQTSASSGSGALTGTDTTGHFSY